jgi:CMP-N-acetylneuraminic acid synthetase
MRPKELATDDAPGVSPALHAIDQLPAYDWIMLLQPTSPMRTAHDIDVAIELAALGSSPAFVSVSATRGNSSWLYYLERSGAMQPIMGWDASTRQEAQQLAYVPNGAVYLADCSWLGRSQSFITPETMGFVMPAERSIDIDTELDWHLAEFLLQRLSK